MDFGSLLAYYNWVDKYYYANGQKKITGIVGNDAIRGLADTLTGIINTVFAQTDPKIQAAITTIIGTAPAQGNTLGKLYNLVMALETTDIKDTYAAMAATAYVGNKLIVVKNASDGPDALNGAALYFYNSSTVTFEFLSRYDNISFTPEPAGEDSQIQINSNGSTGADPNFRWMPFGLLLGADKSIQLQNGTLQLIPIPNEGGITLSIRMDGEEIGRLSKDYLDIFGNTANNRPRVQHPETDDAPFFSNAHDTTTGLGFSYDITDETTNPAFFVQGFKAFEFHKTYLKFPDGSILGSRENNLELYPASHKEHILSLGKTDKRFQSILLKVGDLLKGDSDIEIDYKGFSYTADLSEQNLENPFWIPHKKWVEEFVSGSISTPVIEYTSASLVNGAKVITHNLNTVVPEVIIYGDGILDAGEANTRVEVVDANNLRIIHFGGAENYKVRIKK